ncbi:MAG: LON peptidase substrate-binding domain-containing protein [Actinomycetota bacterium]|nr:LON peptidase substrate-binding domain-containing protein [Actinomycetota bacterium]
MADDIPMFPLGTVLLPGAHLPLHVFEPRYRRLVEDCLSGGPEFGIVLIERGSEVGGGDRRFDVGCVARILSAARLDEGRWLLSTVGTRRVRVLQWLPDAPYPRARVEPWDDPSPRPGAAERRSAALRALRRVLALAAELGESVAEATTPIGEQPVLAGYQMAALAPVGPLDRLDLLAAPTPDDRLDRLALLLEEEASVLASRLEAG